jgi:hypothetical protein
MLQRLERTLHWKKGWREAWWRLVKKSVLHHSPSSVTLNCLSDELMSIESRPANREEELPWADGPGINRISINPPFRQTASGIKQCRYVAQC